jgi:AcrR family transcriptional regulator
VTHALTSRPEARRRLRDAALRLFHRRGYPTTSVQEIVEAAGVTKGAFYYYFDSKEALLRELHDEFIDDELDRARRVLARDLPADDTLAALVEELLLSVEEHQEAITVFFRERRFLSEETFEAIREKRDAFERIITATIERGISDGLFAPLESPRLVAFGIIGMCAWAHEWFRPGGEYSAAAVARMYSTMVLDGLRRA